MELYLGILLGFVALWLVVFAFVRRRRGDEPHCRRCGFELSGLTEPTVCPECGRTLDVKRAIVAGIRPGKKTPLFWALGLSLLSGSLILIDRASVTGWMPVAGYKPAWYLAREAQLLDVTRADIATLELESRYHDGKLSADAWQSLVNIACERHANTGREFPGAQWRVITTAMEAGLLSEEQFESVCKNAIRDLRVVSVAAGDRSFTPGQSVEIIGGIDYRAGLVVSRNGLDLGPTVVHSFKVECERSDGEVFSLRPSIAAFPDFITYPPGATQPGSMHKESKIKTLLPESTGSFVLRVTMQSRYISTPRFTIDPELLSKIAQHTHSTTVEYPIQIGAEPGYALPAINPYTINPYPKEYIEFDISNYSENPDGWIVCDLSVMLKEAVEPDIGFGGHLVLSQGGAVRRVPIPGNGISPNTPKRVTLEGMYPGELRISYVYDQAVAREMRQGNSRVLGHPRYSIDLGTFEIPYVSEMNTKDANSGG